MKAFAIFNFSENNRNYVIHVSAVNELIPQGTTDWAEVYVDGQRLCVELDKCRFDHDSDTYYYRGNKIDRTWKTINPSLSRVVGSICRVVGGDDAKIKGWHPVSYLTLPKKIKQKLSSLTNFSTTLPIPMPHVNQYH